MEDGPATSAPGYALDRLAAEGVSPWLAGFHRGLDAARWAPAGVRGAVFDPGAPARALRSQPAYGPQLARLSAAAVSAGSAAWALTVRDLRHACDLLGPLHAATRGMDGLVSGGTDPAAVRPTDGPALAAEAAELVRAVRRPNFVVRLPSTPAGLAAARECLGRGIGVHLSGVLRVRRYAEVLDACFAGLEAARSAGLPLAEIATLASVPVADLDAAVDARLPENSAGRELRGHAGLCAARLLHALRDRGLESGRWRALRAAGARPPRLLFVAPPAGAVRCAEQFVSWGTVQAIPPALWSTLTRSARPGGEALLGQARAAHAVLRALATLGLRYEALAAGAEAAAAARDAAGWAALRAAVGDGLHAAAHHPPEPCAPGAAAVRAATGHRTPCPPDRP
jgi:transaldolase